MSVDPDIPEAHQLRGWFDNVGRNQEAASISDQRGGGGGERGEEGREWMEGGGGSGWEEGVSEGMLG